MEIWDAYKADGTLAGFDLIRMQGMSFPHEIYHLVCDVLVKHKDGDYLIMQRDYNKIGWPGMFKCSAGGSALKGESPLDCAIRELKEETGISCNDLVGINSTICDETHSIYHEYICEVDCPKDSIVLQTGETISYKWLNKIEFLDFISSELLVPSNKERYKEFFNSIK